MANPPAAVYHLHNEHGDLLYVGMSINPTKRFKQHAAKRPWWDEVDQSKNVITWYRDRFAAAIVEQRDERALGPRHGRDQPAFGRLFIQKLAAQGYDISPIPAPDSAL